MLAVGMGDCWVEEGGRGGGGGGGGGMLVEGGGRVRGKLVEGE